MLSYLYLILSVRHSSHAIFCFYFPFKTHSCLHCCICPTRKGSSHQYLVSCLISPISISVLFIGLCSSRAWSGLMQQPMFAFWQPGNICIYWVPWIYAGCPRSQALRDYGLSTTFRRAQPWSINCPDWFFMRDVLVMSQHRIFNKTNSYWWCFTVS